MTATPDDTPKTPQDLDLDSESLLKALRRKEGNWVEWGQACQSLQKAGYNPQTIFEETGFEPVQQNQVIVGSQVYSSIVSVGVSDAVRSHFEQRGSDILYELRILAQTDRAAAASFILSKGLDADEARDIAKAIKDYSWVQNRPDGFSDHPGDAVAYRFWKLARQTSELQARSRLIAQGLRFVESAEARKLIEQLLTDFTVTRDRPAPRLPIYRLESVEELPRVVPVAGQWPLSLPDFKAVPLTEEEGSFRMVKFSGSGAWVPLPGWQVVLSAEDPVGILAKTDQLPTPMPGPVEPILFLIDRAQRQWNADSYFVVENEGQLQLQWFDAEPQIPLLGRLVLLVRPKKVLDEDFSQ
jgi:hypothetical protein